MPLLHLWPLRLYPLAVLRWPAHRLYPLLLQSLWLHPLGSYLWLRPLILHTLGFSLRYSDRLYLLWPAVLCRALILHPLLSA